MDILSQFAVRGGNLSRIESRPTGEGIGRYCFFIDCEGHVAAPQGGEELMGLRRTCSEVRFLGSYPMADAAPQPGHVAGGNAPVMSPHVAFTEAPAWLGRIRPGA